MHRADARAKVVVLVLFSVGLFFIPPGWGLLAAACLVAAVFAASRLPARAVFLTPAPVSTICVLTLFCKSLAFADGAMRLSIEGFLEGGFLSLRICLLVWAGLILCYSTTSTQLVRAFLWYMEPLRRFHIPVNDIAMVLSIALRFIPLIAYEYDQIRQAQWSRGAAFDRGGLYQRLRAHARVLLPLIVGLFRRADRLASAMDVRCYGMEKPPSGCYDDTR